MIEKYNDQNVNNQFGSLFILIDNRDNHVIRAKYMPCSQEIITDKTISAFKTLNSDFEKFKVDCIKDESLSEIKDATILHMNLQNTDTTFLPDLASPKYVEEHLMALNKHCAGIADLTEERKRWANNVYKTEIGPLITKDFKAFPALIKKYSQYPEIIHLMAAGFLLNHPSEFSTVDQEFLQEIRQTKIYKENNINEDCDTCKVSHITHLEIVMNYIAQNNKRGSELCCLYQAQIGNAFKYLNVRNEIIIRQMELLANKFYTDIPYAFVMPLQIKNNLSQFWMNGYQPANTLEEKLMQQLKLFTQLSKINISTHFAKSKERTEVYLQLARSRIDYLKEYLQQKGYSPGLQKHLEDLKIFMTHIPENYSIVQDKIYNDFQLISTNMCYYTDSHIIFDLKNQMESLKHIEKLTFLLQNNKVKCIFSGLLKGISPDLKPNSTIPASVILNRLTTLSLNINYNQPLFNLKFKVNSNVFNSNTDGMSIFCQDLMQNICHKDTPFIVCANTKDQTTEISILSSNISDNGSSMLTHFRTFRIEYEMKASMWSHRLPVLSYQPKQQIKENLNEFLTNRPDRLLPPLSKGNCKRI